MATASHLKFPEALEHAKVEVEENETIQELFKKPTKYDEMRKGEDWEKILRQRIEQIS